MIKPLFSLLEDAYVSQRTGVLILVVGCREPSPKIFTLSLTFRTGELAGIQEGNRRGQAAFRLLHEASFVRYHQWLDLPEDDEPMMSDLPSLGGVLDDVADDLTAPWAEEEPSPSESCRVERLSEIQAFMQAMAGSYGNDVFLKRVFEHPPSDDWEKLMAGLGQDIEALLGAEVAARVMTGKSLPGPTGGL